jgi:hypothetical protein
MAFIRIADDHSAAIAALAASETDRDRNVMSISEVRAHLRGAHVRTGQKTLNISTQPIKMVRWLHISCILY